MRSELSRLFARRLREEMDARGELSGNALAKRAGIGQRSVARILLPDGHKDQQTPSLDVVDKLSNALGVPAWALMMEADMIEQHVIRPPPAPPRGAVYKLPPVFPSIFSSSKRGKKSRGARKK